MSAWCLGVLNSHRRFFLSYVSPVLWNAAIIAAAIVAGGRARGSDARHREVARVGRGDRRQRAQFLVQLPTVIRLLRGLRAVARHAATPTCARRCARSCRWCSVAARSRSPRTSIR